MQPDAFDTESSVLLIEINILTVMLSICIQSICKASIR